jgi:predicted 2-oxoglutarate/Fe(II)-dependent dioxygenase YbiX
MFRFYFPPQHVYEVFGSPRREEITHEFIDPDSDIGVALKQLADTLGAKDPQFELHWFPRDHNGPHELQDRPNSHVFQLLGQSLVDGQTILAGGVATQNVNTVIAQSFAWAPCVFARISFSETKPAVDMQHQVRQDIAAAHPEAKYPVDQDLVKRIMVKDDVIPPEVCQKIIKSLYEMGKGEVLTNPYENKTMYAQEYRSVNLMNTNKKKLVRKTLESVIIDHVEHFFDTTMEFWNHPVLLQYQQGDFFVPHVDSENFNQETGEWTRIYDRDYTLVCFLNEDYEGGELAFPDYDFVATPKTGRVICFPGDHLYRHGANETTKGTRYQLVSWLTAYGTPRTNIPPNPSVTYRQWSHRDG